MLFGNSLKRKGTTMLRLKTLLFRTSKDRHDRKRKHPVISKINKASLAMDGSGLFVLFTGKSVDLKSHRERLRGRGPYAMLAKLYFDDEDGKKMQNPKCFIHCSCDDFKFRSEVALAIRGSSAIVYSNGMMPKITNPNSVPHVCKHSLAFLEKCVAYLARNKDIPASKTPKAIKSDRELIESLHKPRTSAPDVRRMFRNYFANHSITGTRF